MQSKTLSILLVLPMLTRKKTMMDCQKGLTYTERFSILSEALSFYNSHFSPSIQWSPTPGPRIGAGL